MRLRKSLNVARMIVYEVTATVELEITEAYEEFMLGHHIPDLMRTGCFVSASFEKSEPGRYRICYGADTRETLERYLEQYATKLRRDLIDHFPTGVDLSREEWTVIRTFT